MERVAGACDGPRDLLVDGAGVKLLALCETDEGTVVTAITGERLTEAGNTCPRAEQYERSVSH